MHMQKLYQESLAAINKALLISNENANYWLLQVENKIILAPESTNQHLKDLDMAIILDPLNVNAF